MLAGRIISYHANNGHITMDIFLQDVVYLVQKKPVEMLLHVPCWWWFLAELRSEEKPLRAKEQSFDVAAVQIYRRNIKLETGKTSLTSFCGRAHG